MAVVQVITFKTQPGSGDTFARDFAPIIAAVRKEPGCERYELFRAVDNADTFVMVERWSDQAAIDAALKLFPGRDHPSVAFLKLLAGPPSRERCEV
ncbi:MAG TPA: putative quinol monooxygenase [Polyangiaceae bacterium]|jgi:quinol monooxygenase YgiN|nr:putative quinol monooxygenase [Polyangiaceae bacterium]